MPCTKSLTYSQVLQNSQQSQNEEKFQTCMPYLCLPASPTKLLTPCRDHLLVFQGCLLTEQGSCGPRQRVVPEHGARNRNRGILLWKESTVEDRVVCRKQSRNSKAVGQKLHDCSEGIYTLLIGLLSAIGVLPRTGRASSLSLATNWLLSCVNLDIWVSPGY